MLSAIVTGTDSSGPQDEMAPDSPQHTHCGVRPAHMQRGTLRCRHHGQAAVQAALLPVVHGKVSASPTSGTVVDRGGDMNEYEAVLNAPDREERKRHLDILCKQKIAEGMYGAAFLLETNSYIKGASFIRHKAAEMEKGNEL